MYQRNNCLCSSEIFVKVLLISFLMYKVCQELDIVNRKMAVFSYQWYNGTMKMKISSAVLYNIEAWCFIYKRIWKLCVARIAKQGDKSVNVIWHRWRGWKYMDWCEDCIETIISDVPFKGNLPESALIHIVSIRPLQSQGKWTCVLCHILSHEYNLVGVKPKNPEHRITNIHGNHFEVYILQNKVMMKKIRYIRAHNWDKISQAMLHYDYHQI